MVKKFLSQSPLAEKVKVDSKVVLERLKFSAADLDEIRSRGDFSVDNRKESVVELEANGITVALGKIVKKKGESYFKVTQMKEEKK